jgi:hypothetical protein
MPKQARLRVSLISSDYIASQESGWEEIELVIQDDPDSP